ncbi:MAG: hypothetical protein AAB417_03840 [Patescibacteria group bacterium]
MDDKQTQKVTLDDLASMIERNIAHKEDIDRLENHMVGMDGKMNKMVEMIAQLPTRDEMRDLLSIRQRVDEIARNIREKLHVEV